MCERLTELTRKPDSSVGGQRVDLPLAEARSELELDRIAILVNELRRLCGLDLLDRVQKCEVRPAPVASPSTLASSAAAPSGAFSYHEYAYLPSSSSFANFDSFSG